MMLFTRSGSEEKLIGLLDDKLKANGFSPFLPTKEMPYRSKGVIYKKRKSLFPGYIFPRTEVAPDLIADQLRVALKERSRTQINPE